MDDAIIDYLKEVRAGKIVTAKGRQREIYQILIMSKKLHKCYQVALSNKRL